MQETFSIIKPDATKRNLTGSINMLIENSGLRIIAQKRIKLNKNNVGILVCGSGTGMNLAANKHKNVRAAQCFNLKSTKLSRLHNDANIITLGSRLISKKNALKFISVFLNTKFDGGRHLKRLKKI